MKRTILCIAIAIAVVPTHAAWADDPAPTKEQLESAKKAFTEGKALYEAGKFLEAVEKFKESYRLSRNAVLLYNIGHTLDQAGQKEKALFYYRKFLADAPPTATQRKEVQKRVDALEKENLEADLQGTSTAAPANNATTTAKPEEPKQVKIKPAGTYSDKDFQHQTVDAAPPSKPLDVSAFVPEDSGFQVTLYYRGAGESKYVGKPMKWRYKELVARIPAKLMTGNSVQYYIEVKDQGGNVIAKSGKSTSPNLVNIDATAAPRFYPDLADEGVEVAQPEAKRHEDNPLGPKQAQAPLFESGPEQETKPAQSGLTDVGSSKFNKAKWVSTGAAGVLLAGAATTYLLAAKQASNLHTDAFHCGMPPCQVFDKDYDLAVQQAGERYNTMYHVTLVLGVASAGVAAYFWYREMTAKKHGELKVSNKNNSPETTWAVTPAIADGFTGAAAAARF